MPNRRRKVQVTDGETPASWLDVKFCASQFNYREWPSVSPARFQDFSVGEEQSESHVSALAWSPPGIMKHDRCALAVLTSNLLLSIWLATTDVANVGSWRRVCVVNRSIQSYLECENPNLDDNADSLRRRGRVRAATWAPAYPDRSRYGGEDQNDPVGLLAILNDNAEVILLKLSRQTETQIDPSVEALSRVSFAPESSKALDQTAISDRIEWHPWLRTNKGIVSSITCASKLGKITAELQWEPAPGTASESCHVQIGSTRLEHANGISRSWPLHPAQLMASTNLYLSEQIESLKRAFGEKHGLGSQVSVHYWGYCSYKQFVAVHISLHPRLMIQYAIFSNEMSYIVFSHEILETSMDTAEPVSFDWDLSHTLITHAEACIEPWLFINEQFPLEHITGLSERQAVSSVDAAPEEAVPDMSSERICRKMIHSYFLSALCYGWEIDKRAGNLATWAFGKGTDALDVIQNTMATLHGNLGDESCLGSIEEMDVLFAASGRNLGFEYCEICDQRILWDGMRLAECAEGHQSGR